MDDWDKYQRRYIWRVIIVVGIFDVLMLILLAVSRG